MIIKSILQAIEYLHVNGVCHRDLKPDNIFVCDTKVTLIDFNVAARLNQVDVQEIMGGTGLK